MSVSLQGKILGGLQTENEQLASRVAVLESKLRVADEKYQIDIESVN